MACPTHISPTPRRQDAKFFYWAFARFFGLFSALYVYIKIARGARGVASGDVEELTVNYSLFTVNCYLMTLVALLVPSVKVVTWMVMPLGWATCWPARL